MKIGDVRRAQIITTYGVGALIAFNDKSYMIAGLDHWTVGEPDLMEQRLARRLRVSGFVLPPAEQEKKDIPVIRFPLWHSCADCNRLEEYRSLLEEIRCKACEGRLVPSRFVVCCPKGHIDDFPYFRWVHSGKDKNDAKHSLYIETSGASASLQGLLVKCLCGAARTLHGAFAKNAIGSCSGKRPWIGGDPENCTETARALQRGASNVWFSQVESSLSIPPWSDAVFMVLDRHWTVLKTLTDRDTLKNTLSKMSAVRASGFDLDEIVEVALQRQAGERTEADEPDLKLEEYRALCHGYPQTHHGDEFVCLPATQLTKFIAQLFQRVMLVTRLREVRALRSFTRVLPFAPGAAYKDFPPLSQEPRDWLPAIEVNGEGVFFEFDQKRLFRWESRADVKDRASSIDTHYSEMLRQSDVTSNLVVTPRLLLLHTFAHAVITQWSLECGYPAASLRERLYVGDEMSGVLVYTATGDSAGSLGGVIGQASSDRLEPGIREAFARASWCSGDPVCIEAEAQGTNSLNRAACHACVLLPEVSCEFGNVFLDRGMLTGWPEHREAGFFADFIN